MPYMPYAPQGVKGFDENEKNKWKAAINQV